MARVRPAGRCNRPFLHGSIGVFWRALDKVVFASRGLLVCAVVIVQCGGCGFTLIPNQADFATLSSLADSDQAVVRIYAATLPGTAGLAAHAWFVLKSAEATSFDRWEVWLEGAGPSGFVQKNRFAPERDIGCGGVVVLAELIGPRAEPVVDFIQTESSGYPFRNTYVVLPGPNSSTYIQWVLDRTGWQVFLPPVIMGENAALLCP